MKKVMGMFLIMAAFSTVGVFAQKPAVVATNEPGWHHIGQTEASFKLQNESISVLGADEFSALKLKVTDAGLQLERMQVFYESGDMEEIDLRTHFSSNSESGAIHLKHPDKDIQKVAFTYKTAPNAQGEKADIDLYGLKTNQPAGRDSYREEKEELREEARETEQEVEEEARETEVEIEQDAQSAGDKIEEGAKDAAATITDQKLKNKVGPGGENAYVDEDGRYYIINDEGEKVWITVDQLRDKPDND